MSLSSLSELMDSDPEAGSGPGHRGRPRSRWTIPVAVTLLVSMLGGTWLATRTVVRPSAIVSAIAAPVAAESPPPSATTPAVRRTVNVNRNRLVGLQRARVVRVLERRGLVVLTVPVVESGGAIGTVSSVAPTGRLDRGETVRVEYRTVAKAPAPPQAPAGGQTAGSEQPMTEQRATRRMSTR